MFLIRRQKLSGNPASPKHSRNPCNIGVCVSESIENVRQAARDLAGEISAHIPDAIANPPWWALIIIQALGYGLMFLGASLYVVTFFGFN